MVSVPGLGAWHSISVVHGVARADECAYRQVFEEASLRIDLHYEPTLTRPEDQQSRPWLGRRGRVQPIVGELLGACPPAEIRLLICGNPSMTADIHEMALERGLEASHIRLETYWPLANASPSR